MADRKFRLCKYGVLRKILGTTAGIHRNHLGERSDSIRARLLGMGRVQVGDVVQREPFVAAQVAAAPLEYLPKKSSDFTRLAELYAKCENLRVSLCFSGASGQRVKCRVRGAWMCRALGTGLTETRGKYTGVTGRRCAPKHTISTTFGSGRRCIARGGRGRRAGAVGGGWRGVVSSRRAGEHDAGGAACDGATARG